MNAARCIWKCNRIAFRYIYSVSHKPSLTVTTRLKNISAEEIVTTTVEHLGNIIFHENICNLCNFMLCLFCALNSHKQLSISWEKQPKKKRAVQMKNYNSLIVVDFGNKKSFLRAEKWINQHTIVRWWALRISWSELEIIFWRCAIAMGK